MKSILPLAILAAIVSIAIIGAAQGPTNGQAPDASPATEESGTGSAGNPGAAASGVPLPAQPAQPAGPNLGPGMPLMPENMPAGPEKGGKGAKGKRSGPGARPSPSGSPRNTFEVEEDIRMRIRMRRAETEAVNEPDIQAYWVAAHETRTDPARRDALKVYYDHLYDRMIKIDPVITTSANARRQALLARLVYARLGDLLPSDNPYATPIPAVSGKNPPASDLPPSL